MGELVIQIIALIAVFFIGGIIGVAVTGSFSPYCWYALAACLGIVILNVCD